MNIASAGHVVKNATAAGRGIFLYRRGGFTVIELLMVIILVGILAAVALPGFVDFGKEAKINTTKTKLAELKQAITGDSRVVAQGQYINLGFKNHLGTNPTTLNDLVAQGSYTSYDPYTKKGWRGPYVNNSDPDWNKDAWGTNLQYNAATQTINSCGPDKTCGNADDISITF